MHQNDTSTTYNNARGVSQTMTVIYIHLFNASLKDLINHLQIASRNKQKGLPVKMMYVNSFSGSHWTLSNI